MPFGIAGISVEVLSVFVPCACAPFTNNLMPITRQFSAVVHPSVQKPECYVCTDEITFFPSRIFISFIAAVPHSFSRDKRLDLWNEIKNVHFVDWMRTAYCCTSLHSQWEIRKNGEWDLSVCVWEGGRVHDGYAHALANFFNFVRSHVCSTL